MLTVTEIRNPAELDSLAAEWEALWSESFDPTFAQTIAWLKAYCATSRNFLGLRCLVVSSEGETIGLLPLVLQRRSTSAGVVNVLGYPDEDGFGRVGPLGKNRAVTLTTVMRHLKSVPRDWDLLELTERAGENAGGTRVSTAMRFNGMAPLSKPGVPMSSLEFTTRWTDFLFTIDSDIRMEYYRSQHNADADGQLNFVRMRSSRFGVVGGADFDQLLEDALMVPGKSGATKQGADFVKALHAEIADEGRSDVSVLYRAGTPIASLFGVVVGGRVEVVYGATIDENRIPLAGRFMQELLADSARRGDHELVWFDDPSLPCYGWGSKTYESSRRLFFSPTKPKAQLLRWGQVASGFFSSQKARKVPPQRETMLKLVSG
ncbi:GNAT family N-acetyltransferase [Calycomorphotria hydatis]|uniref:BioF2-like acetyltransferase domain-containing protein n=1 Tax=Calycomorphotria hydatis TaxID=2528027 RepID=A0A517T8V0_9PLAN|nr:GNAT family N-acetyltransferase [Calycomorphotria hydatis]QDT64812.1 hypothetical protein V22_20550 [Calycomorphotria hydatis]